MGLLFDDIPYLEVAQKEYDHFAQVLREEGVGSTFTLRS